MPAAAADLAILQNGFSIRHERREAIGNLTRLYVDARPQSGYIDVPSDQIASIERDDSPSPVSEEEPTISQPLTIHDLVNSAGGKHGIDPDLIESVIRAESSFNPNAVSRKGAQGLMQLMPATASKLGVTNTFDPASNVDGGTRYLRELLVQYNSDLAKALAAYNAGPRRVQQYNGVPPYRETYTYVAKVISEFNRRKLAQGVGLSPGPKTLRRKSATRQRFKTGESPQKSDTSNDLNARP